MASSWQETYEKLKKRKETIDLLTKNDIVSNMPTKKSTSSTSSTKKKDDDEERTWFNTGLFDDGYDIGDITKTILGTTQDVSENLTKGVARIGEGLVDTGAYLAGGIGKLFGADEFADDTKDFISRNLVDEYKVGEKLSTGLMPNSGLTYIADKILNKGEDVSVLGDKSDSLIQSAGQLGGTIGLQAVGVPWWLTTGVTSFGGETEQAFNQDATYGEAGVSGLVSAAAEVLTEKLSGGISFGGKTLDDTLLKPLTDKIANKTIKTLVNLGLDAAGEGLEEVATEVISSVGQKLTYEDEKTWKEMLASEQAFDNYLEAFIGGAVLGGGFSGVRAVDSIKTGRDYKTGLTDNEQAVVDSEIAARTEGKQLTTKQKKKIEAEVREDLEKGYISTDTIESALGGKTYNQLKSVRDHKTNLETQIKELENKPNAEITVKEMEQLNSLREQLSQSNTNTLESKLQAEIGDRIKSDGYLQRSYQEKAKRSKEFTYEVAETDSEFRRGVLESTKGKLNDTTRSHETAEALVKLSEDRKMQYKFTNTKELQQMKLVPEGKTANGLYVVEKDGKREILVNTDSKKYIEAVLVHETAHDFQTTSPETYTKLQDITREFAEASGDYARIHNEVTEMYKNVEGVNIEEEVTSRLLEDYLGNKEFISNLTTKEPNIVQKIINEVKYLVKKFTAGSPEARKLVELQHKLEETYKEAYRQTEAKKKDVFKDSKVRDDKGNLKKVYHGTRADFDTFDINRSGENYEGGWSNSGRGIYFTEDMTEAEQYAKDSTQDGDTKVKEVYLDIENPFDTSQDYSQLTDMANEYNIEPYYLERGDRLLDWFKNNNIDAGEVLKKYGYDGIVDHGHYVVFDSNQIINADGTRDVKYSLTDNQGRELSKEQQEYFKDSKARDENGKLVTVYHTMTDTGTQFNEFNPTGTKHYRFGDQVVNFYTNDQNMSGSYADQRYTMADTSKITSIDEAKKFIESFDNALTQYRLKEYEDGSKYQIRSFDTGTPLWFENQEDLFKNVKEKLYKYEKQFGSKKGQAKYQYEGYVNITNPYVVDAEGQSWSSVSKKIDEKKVNEILNLTETQKEKLTELAKESKDGYYKYLDANREFEYLVTALKKLPESEQYNIMLNLPLDEPNAEMTYYNWVSSLKVETRQEFAKKYREGEANYHNYKLPDTYFYNELSGILENDYIVKPVEYYELSERGFKDSWGNDLERDYYENLFVAKASTNDIVHQVLEMNKNGANYDGVIIRDVYDYGGHTDLVETPNDLYITFSSEQFKAHDNLNPTSDPDIRYSLSEDNQTILERNAIAEQLKQKGATVDGDGNVTLYHITTPDNYNKIMSDKQFIPNQSPIGGGLTLGEIGDRSFFTYDNEWVETWRQSEDSIVMEVKVPAEYIRQGAKNEKEIYIEGALKQRDNGIWTTDQKPTSTFYDRMAVKRYLRNHPEANLSLSNESDIAPTSTPNQTATEDIRLQVEEIAPTKKSPVTAEKSPVVSEHRQTPMNITDIDYAPITEADLSDYAEQSREAFNTLEDVDSPIEREDFAPVGEQVTPTDSLFDTRDYEEVGSKKVNAYQYDNPEVKPYFQTAAREMLTDLQNSVRGERYIIGDNSQVGDNDYYYSGTKRYTTDDIADLLDGMNGKYKYSYAEIEKGLRAIIKDEGAENNAVSKRIEFYLDKRLREGYTDIEGYKIPADTEYLDMLRAKGITDYYNSIPLDEAPVKTVDKPVDNVSNSKSKLRAEAIRPAPDKDSHGYKMIRVKTDAEIQAETNEEIAEILAEEPKTENTRNKRKWAIIKANVLDKGIVFEDVSLKHKNRELMGKWDYTLTAEARGQNVIGNGHYEYDPYSKTSRKVSKSLNEIREEVESTGLTKEFYEYMYHKHNIDRMRLDILYETENKPVFGYNVTADQSVQKVRELENLYPDFMLYAQDVYDYLEADRNVLVENGVISEETAQLWKDMYPHYVPIRRAGHSNNAINVPLDTGRTGVNAPIKKATGGNQDILPLFDTMASRTLQTHRAAAKNSFGVELKNTIGTTINSQATNIDEVIDSVDAQEELLQEGKNGQKPTFTVFENGEKVTFEITQDMYDALKPLDNSSLLSKTFAVPNKISSFHRGVLTQYNPVFMLTNAIKDAQDILINSQHSAKTYAKVPEATAQLISKGYWYQEYMLHGGEHNSYFDSVDNTFKTENKGLEKILDLPPLKQISQMNDFIERIPRLAEYIASREAGRSVEVSMLDAARVTTNFKAGGNLTKFLNRNGFTFVNASVQGAMQQVRNIREANANGIRGWANLATKFAIAGLPAMILNSLLWEDDEEYEELSDYVKQNYYIVAKTDDGTFIRIPKGRTLAVIQEGFEQMKHLVTGDDEADLKTFIDLFLTNLAPNNPIENNVLSPVVQVVNNKTWYGEDLVPTRLQNLPAAEQYDESTDSFSRWLGEMTNISPVKINYLLDQYTGGIGDVVLPMMTPEAKSDADTLGEQMLAPLKSKFTTNATMNNQNVTDFYDKSEELTTNAKKSTATDEDVLRNKYINSVKAEMNELYAEKREIQNSDLPNSEKYQRVLEVQSQINELSKEALNEYKNVDIYSNYATAGDRQYRLTDDGEWQKINDKQLEKQDEVTSTLGITPNDYWSNKEEYDYAYENPSKYALANAIADYSTFRELSSELYDIKADKDENGKSISGSRKEKVFDYINNLDLDFEQRIMLAKLEYPSYDEYNYEIIDYLNEREDISYEQMVSILTELGFTVKKDGTIVWD